jgi:hypothetical protein
MKFLMIVKASKDSEAGKMPGDKLIDQMTRYNKELLTAGVLLDGAGLQPSSNGTRVQFSGGKKTVIDGPFAETKELIAGYWLIQVKSRQEALDWLMKAPNPAGENGEGQIELRQFFEMEDFGDSPAVERAREVEKNFESNKK